MFRSENEPPYFFFFFIFELVNDQDSDRILCTLQRSIENIKIISMKTESFFLKKKDFAF